MSRKLSRVLWSVAALPALVSAGCTTSSEGIDLTERGVLDLVVTRVSGSTIATATAQVSDNDILSFPYTEIVLADDQIVSVNDVPLTATVQTALGLDAAVAATIEAVESTETYAISFDNQGVVTTFEAAPPEDFSDVSPDDSTEVSRDGFEVTWDASDDDDATITVTIAGSVLSYADDGSLEVADYEVTLEDLADDGDITIGAAELSQFLNGEITVTLARVETISQKLGFASGTISLEIALELPLTLVESATDEG